MSKQRHTKPFLTEPELRTKYAIPGIAPSALVEAKNTSEPLQTFQWYKCI
jgi:hypothetical protein